MTSSERASDTDAAAAGEKSAGAIGAYRGRPHTVLPPPRATSSALERYGFAVVSTAVALGLRLGLAPWLGEVAPFTPFFVAVLLSAWYGGTGPSILAIVLSTLVSWFLFVQPAYSFRLVRLEDALALTLWSATAGVTAWITSSLRSALLDTQSATLRLTVALGQRDKAEQQLRASEASLQTLVAALPDVIARFNRSLRFEYVSPAVERATGLEPEHFIGKTHIEAGLSPEISERLRDSLRRIFDTGQQEEIRFDLETPAGLRHMVALGVPERDSSGRIEAVLSVVRDETDQRRSELLLQESERRLATLMANLPGMAYRRQPGKAGRMEFVSQGVLELSGYSAPDLMSGNVTWASITHPADYPRILEEAFSAAAARQMYRFKYRIRHRSGEERWVWERGLPIFDGDNPEPIAFEGFVSDITEVVRAEEALRRANQDLEQFAYSASHDIREPLRMVALYTELLKRRFGTALGSEGLSYLDFAHKGALRMEALVRDLLAHTKAGEYSGEHPVPAVDAGEVLERVWSQLQVQVSQTRAELHADPLPFVRMLPFHLEQLLQNVLENGIKYRNDGRPPVIRVVARRDGPLFWRFSVSDNGIGIAPEYHEQVFGLFKRLHREEEYPGTGVGLAICRKVVERYGGRIWVESSAGSGSTFHFLLPAAEENE